nr:MAG TPA: hypothetical protein [Bacteriophage sp.]
MTRISGVLIYPSDILTCAVLIDALLIKSFS